MAKYSVISDVSRTIVELLQAELVPELVQQREQIGVCTADQFDRIIFNVFKDLDREIYTSLLG